LLPGSRLQDYSSIIFHRVSQAQLTGFLATLALAVGIEHIHIAGEDYDPAVIVAFDLLSMHPTPQSQEGGCLVMSGSGDKYWHVKKISFSNRA